MLNILPNINPSEVLKYYNEETPILTNTYIIDGAKQVDTYTAGEVRQYLNRLNSGAWLSVQEAINKISKLF